MALSSVMHESDPETSMSLGALACPIDPKGWMLCYYVNSSDQVQVLRSQDPGKWSFERVVFPGQRLLINAPSAAVLNVQTSQATGVEPYQIECDRLVCTETILTQALD